MDPYYLTYKAQILGYHPQVILAGRRINDSMGKFVAEQTIKQMIAAGSHIKGAKVIVLGLTFKETARTCAIRGSKISSTSLRHTALTFTRTTPSRYRMRCARSTRTATARGAIYPLPMLSTWRLPTSNF